MWPPLLAGLFCLVLISSSGYIINDLYDVKKDYMNPEKCGRPLTSGRIKRSEAVAWSLIFMMAALTLAYFLNLKFLIVCLGLVLSSLLYSAILKRALFADIITISFNFVLRTLGGFILIGISSSPWLLMGVFFSAFFLAIGKRYSEFLLLKEQAAEHRDVFRFYTPELLDFLMTIGISILILSFALFTLFSEHSKNIAYLLPLFVYLILRYVWHIKTGSIVARHPHKIYHDKGLFYGLIIFLLLAVSLIYFW